MFVHHVNKSAPDHPSVCVGHSVRFIKQIQECEQNRMCESRFRSLTFILRVFLFKVFSPLCVQYTIQQHNLSWLSAVEGA